MKVCSDSGHICWLALGNLCVTMKSEAQAEWAAQVVALLYTVCGAGMLFSWHAVL